MTVEEFWKSFLKDTGKSPDTTYLESFYFDLSEKWANELLRLVMIGQKSATSSSLLTYQKEKLRVPQVGDYSIVTDWDGNPRCVIETTEVMILPFSDITYEICRAEGEDENLESWRAGHISFFTEEGKDVGYTFSEDMPVVFENFKAVYQSHELKQKEFCFKAADGLDKDFVYLCERLDRYLDELVGGNAQRQQYEQYNLRDDIHDVYVVYENGHPIACGSMRRYDEEHAEIKRVFVEPEYRNFGIGKQLMGMLEAKAAIQGYECCILETGNPLEAACHMYQRMGYHVIPNYGPYKDMKESICMQKVI